MNVLLTPYLGQAESVEGKAGNLFKRGYERVLPAPVASAGADLATSSQAETLLNFIRSVGYRLCRHTETPFENKRVLTFNRSWTSTNDTLLVRDHEYGLTHFVAIEKGIVFLH